MRRHHVLLSLLFLLAGGCVSQTEQQFSYHYVYEVGNAKKITAWAMEQQSPRKVVDAMAALMTIPNMRWRFDYDDAVEGYARIYEKLLTGWPTLVFPEYPWNDIEQLRDWTDRHVEANRLPRNEELRELVHRVKARHAPSTMPP